MNELTGCSGLKNLGNTCYLNSIIQCLSNCNLFKSYLLSEQFIKDIVKNETNEEIISFSVKKNLCFQLRRIFSHMWKYTYEEQKFWKPDSFRKLLSVKDDMFSNNHQHDSQEILIRLLDIFNEELGNKIIIKNTKNIYNDILDNLYKNNQMNCMIL